MVYAEEAPVLDAYQRSDCDGLAVWCAHCHQWHVHGHGGGHRVAHCFDTASPYQRSGYILQPIGQPIPRYKNGQPRPPTKVS